MGRNPAPLFIEKLPWVIINRLHRILGIAFQEDQSRVFKDNASVNNEPPTCSDGQYPESDVSSPVSDFFFGKQTG